MKKFGGIRAYCKLCGKAYVVPTAVIDIRKWFKTVGHEYSPKEGLTCYKCLATKWIEMEIENEY